VGRAKKNCTMAGDFRVYGNIADDLLKNLDELGILL
jgi:hypothetical protein